VTDDEMRASMRAGGMPEAVVEGVIGMTAGSRGLALDPPRSPLSTTPTALGGWVYANLRPQL
jgi:hypothetical protein